MSRELPAWLPPTIKTRMIARDIKSVRELERQAGFSNGLVVGMCTQYNNESLLNILTLLRTLGYSCNSPEFDVINELVSENDLKHRRVTLTIPSVHKTSNSYVLKTMERYKEQAA